MNFEKSADGTACDKACHSGKGQVSAAASTREIRRLAHSAKEPGKIDCELGRVGGHDRGRGETGKRDPDQSILGGHGSHPEHTYKYREPAPGVAERTERNAKG